MNISVCEEVELEKNVHEHKSKLSYQGFLKSDVFIFHYSFFFHHVGLASKMAFLSPMPFIQFTEIGSPCLIRFMSRWPPNTEAARSPPSWQQELRPLLERQSRGPTEAHPWLGTKRPGSELDVSTARIICDKAFNLPSDQFSHLGIS